ncbi:MAG: O-antigen ligase family protein [Bacteroidales bacterium]|nr:O-antigen ligase family protein [Bacteroidales bacterium]
MGEFKMQFNERVSWWYQFSLFLLIASIPLSKYTMSLTQFILLGFWLLYNSDITYLEEFRAKKGTFASRLLKVSGGFLISIIGSLRDKFILFSKNKAALAVTSILIMHVIGLIYTSDFHYAFKDLRTKLPLLLLPLFLSTGPSIKTKALYWLLLGYVAAVFAGTIYRSYLYLSLDIADSRAFNAHISHIRFSLNAVFSIFILYYLSRQKDLFPVYLKAIFLAVAAWFLFFMIFLSYTTGVSIFVILLILLLIYNSVQGRTLRVKLLWLFGGLLLIAAPSLYFVEAVREYRHPEQLSFRTLERHTINGNSYYHDTVNFRIENGHYVGLYICNKEIRNEWAKRSKLSIDSLDGKQQRVRYTLIRYLASRGLRKDSIGVAQLSTSDIRNIEAGITDASARNGFNFHSQLDNFLVGWDNYIRHGNPNSSSLIQRFVYWKTSIVLIMEHPIIGVGTGDVPDAFRKRYDEIHSNLDPQYRLRSHNQYLSLAVAFGIPGLIWFLLALYYPAMKRKGFRHFLFVIFYVIFILSMFTEDTIETQEGVTFYALFVSLFLFAWAKPEEGPGSSDVTQ